MLSAATTANMVSNESGEKLFSSKIFPIPSKLLGLLENEIPFLKNFLFVLISFWFKFKWSNPEWETRHDLADLVWDEDFCFL